MYAFAPDGTPITGTLEVLSGEAYTRDGSFYRGPDGALAFDHAGETEVFWDDQTTVTRNGKVVFIDRDGAEWTAAQVVLSEDENWEPEAEEVKAPVADPASALRAIVARVNGEWDQPDLVAFGALGDLSADVLRIAAAAIPRQHKET